MFDIGWPELLMVAIVMILVVGPKDLPGMLRAFGKTVKKYRGMARDFQSQFNEALEEAELDELRNTVDSAKKLNPINQIKDTVNEAIDEVTPVKPWVPKPEEISDVARSVGKKPAAKTAAAKKATSTAKKPAAASKTSTARKAASKAPAAKTASKATTTKTTATKKPAAAKTATKASTKSAAKPAAKRSTVKTTPAKAAAKGSTPAKKPRTTTPKKAATATGTKSKVTK